MPTLDPDMKAVLDEIAAAGDPPLWSMTPVEARRVTDTVFAPYWNADRPGLPSIVDRELPGPGGPIPFRLYDPGVGRPAPCLVYLHGGGWVICNRDSHDGICRHLAKAAGVMVASIEYRLAPEHRFPAAVDDCIAAVRWLAERGGKWGIDPTRLAVGGDSAGGNLSLVTLMALRDGGGPHLRGGLLIYGAFSTATDTASHRAFGGGEYILSSREMAWFLGHYLGKSDDWRDPRAAPLLGEVGGLPPLMVTATDLDPLLDDSLRLVEKLRAAGAAPEFRLWQGVVHASLHMTRRVPAIHGHIADMGHWLRGVLAI